MIDSSGRVRGAQGDKAAFNQRRAERLRVLLILSHLRLVAAQTQAAAVGSCGGTGDEDDLRAERVVSPLAHVRTKATLRWTLESGIRERSPTTYRASHLPLTTAREKPYTQLLCRKILSTYIE